MTAVVTLIILSAGAIVICLGAIWESRLSKAQRQRAYEEAKELGVEW